MGNDSCSEYPPIHIFPDQNCESIQEKRTRSASHREMADAAYKEQIKQIYDDSHQTYGQEAIWHNMQESGNPAASIGCGA
jgi:hypothetical protein